MVKKSFYSFNIPIKVLAVLFLWNFILIHANCISDCDILIQERAEPKFLKSRRLNEASDLEISPGSTKELKIYLKGANEEILMDFRASEPDFTKFKIDVLRDKQLESTIDARIAVVETLKIVLDYQKKICQVIGNVNFQMTVPIKDDAYKISVENNKAGTVKIEDRFDLINSSYFDTNNIIGLIVTVGVCLIAMLVIRMFLNAKKARNLLIEDLDISPVSPQDSPRRVDNEAAINSHLSLAQDVTNSEKKVCEERTILGLEEISTPVIVARIEFNHQEKLEVKEGINNKNDPNTLLSTAQTLSVIPPLQKAFTPSSLANMRSMNEESVFSMAAKGEFTPVHKEPVANSIILESMDLKSKAHDRCCSNEDFPADSSRKNKKPGFPYKKNVEGDGDLLLSMDLFSDCEGKYVPTIVAIKDLVAKMREEGTLGIDADPSIDSDEEDQYEAPQLPDYFCCMLCFEGRRCTIVGPCRHVFACVDCIEELLDTYKICVLCANKINQYEML